MKTNKNLFLISHLISQCFKEHRDYIKRLHINLYIADTRPSAVTFEIHSHKQIAHFKLKYLCTLCHEVTCVT